MINCQCLSVFTGRYCETKIICPSNFCQNGGTCQILNYTPRCSCSDLYVGVHCETHKMCSPNPCMNNGNCSGTGASSYSCSCPKGFTGVNCQFVDRCLSNPCKNGGSCANLNSGNLFLSSKRRCEAETHCHKCTKERRITHVKHF